MRAVLIVTLFVILLLIAPALLYWPLNTISEQGSLGWYIPHNFWTYLAGYGVMGCLGGGYRRK